MKKATKKTKESIMKVGNLLFIIIIAAAGIALTGALWLPTKVSMFLGISLLCIALYQMFRITK